ncbi:scavenger receptor cysteine-rich type 1 M130-like protein [Labeo rohita]|uniref:Scavenger receptor cysteine-rich type 1 M130-like protein n=1 Tax=Labeo rohita TaxID=84645 RepID=A0A498L9B0_LABRO|nr:scavenger receptor cysteine-rich type 1 M130-like protein [Labeo rohita]
MDRDTASLICQELNCGRSGSEPTNSKGLKPHNWLDEFKCRRHDSTIWQCPSLPWGQYECDNDVAKITCSMEEYHESPRSRLTCLISPSPQQKQCSNSSLALHDGLVRLSGERQCEGEVEVFIHQVWRRVLLDSWSLTESSVVCRQLGCGSVLNFYGSSSSPEHSHECVTGFQCSGSEAHLGNCSSPQTLNCSSTQQLSITCLEFKEIRLTEGCEGNVEVFYNGSWGNVCYNQMDRDTASLICQELNCGRSGDLSDSTARVKSTPYWLDKVTCRRHDSTIWQCPSSPWGENYCNEDEVAKIICSNLSVSTTSATTTSNSLPVRSKSFTSTQTPPAESPQFFVPPVLVIVLVVVLLLLLVPLLILIQQNRVMRRALSKRRHRTTTEAVYEEIQHKPTNRHSLLTQRGSVLSEEQHSRYEDADELLSDLPDLSVSTTPATTTSASPPALSKRRHTMTTEAVYEEIQHKHNHFTQRGSLMSEELHSGYEDADELLSGSLIFDEQHSGNEDANELLSDLLASTTHAKTSAFPPGSPPMHSTSVTPPQTPPAASLSVPPVLVIVLVVVLLLLLVPLLILIQQNRVMRRALSKRRHRTTTEAVYEEIQHRPTNRHSLFTQRGSVIYEEQHSGYEDAEFLSEQGLEEYDDVMNVCENLRDLSDLPDLSVSTTPATTTSASPPALSKRRHRMTTEAVYEEIQHKHNHFTQRGSLISEELHSGYKDADELLSARSAKGVTPEYH